MNEKEVKMSEAQRLTRARVRITIGGKPIMINEPTLGVMDLMTQEWLKWDIDIKENTSNLEALVTAKQNLAAHAKELARAVAIGIVGERCFTPIIGKLRVSRTAKNVYRRMTHTECRQIAEILTGAVGLMDFMVSMKLMSAAETTRKNEVE